MTIIYFNKSILPIINSIFTLCGLISVYLLWYQIRLQNKWNKLMSNFKIYDNSYDEAENKTIIEAAKIGIKLRLRQNALSEDEVKKILESTDVYLAVMSFLDKMEYCATAINAGIINIDFAYKLYGSKYIGLKSLYEPFIKKIRQENNDSGIYIEISNIVEKFSKIKESEERRSKQTFGVGPQV